MPVLQAYELFRIFESLEAGPEWMSMTIKIRTIKYRSI